MNQPYRTGGLLRCCVARLAEAPEGATEGATHACGSCSSQVVVRDGAWEWRDPRAVEAAARLQVLGP